jgi:hypothetical protein
MVFFPDEGVPTIAMNMLDYVALQTAIRRPDAHFGQLLWTRRVGRAGDITGRNRQQLQPLYDITGDGRLSLSTSPA